MYCMFGNTTENDESHAHNRQPWHTCRRIRAYLVLETGAFDYIRLRMQHCVMMLHAAPIAETGYCKSMTSKSYSSADVTAEVLLHVLRYGRIGARGVMSSTTGDVRTLE